MGLSSTTFFIFRCKYYLLDKFRSERIKVSNDIVKELRRMMIRLKENKNITMILISIAHLIIDLSVLLNLWQQR